MQYINILPNLDLSSSLSFDYLLSISFSEEKKKKTSSLYQKISREEEEEEEISIEVAEMNEDDANIRFNHEPRNNHRRRPSSSSSIDGDVVPIRDSSSLPSTNPHQTPRKPNPRFIAFVIHAVVMAVVISLFFLFVGIAAIVLIHICIAGRALHRRRHRRTTPRFLETDDEDFNFGIVGLSLNNLRKLPSFIYGEEEEEMGFDLGLNRDCSICLEGLKEGERCRMLPGCKHVFHGNCIDSWLIRVAACPICRGDVELKLDVGGGGGSSQYVKEVGTVEVFRRVGSIGPDYGM